MIWLLTIEDRCDLKLKKETEDEDEETKSWKILFEKFVVNLFTFSHLNRSIGLEEYDALRFNEKKTRNMTCNLKK